MICTYVCVYIVRSAKPTYIAYVVRHSTSATGESELCVQAFPAATILHDAIDGPYAMSDELTQVQSISTISLTDYNVFIVRLILCESDGKVRFVMQ